MHTPSRSRRSFLGTLGALSTVSLAPGSWLSAAGQAPPRQPSPARGLAPAGDFLFAPGLVYLQTGSLGPTPRPVMERAISAWTEMESNPVFYAYGPHEQAMEGVRAKAAGLIG